MQSLEPAAKAVFQRSDRRGCVLDFSTHEFVQTVKNCDSTMVKVLKPAYPINLAAAYAFQDYANRLEDINGHSLAITDNNRRVIIDGLTRFETQTAIPRMEIPDIEGQEEEARQAIISVSQAQTAITMAERVKKYELYLAKLEKKPRSFLGKLELIVMALTAIVFLVGLGVCIYKCRKDRLEMQNSSQFRT